MNKVNLRADGVPDKQLELSHAQRLLDYQKTQRVAFWHVDDENYHVVNGTIEPNPSFEAGNGTETQG